MGKSVKKVVKSVTSAFKSAWKGVQKLVDSVAKVIVDALKTVWDKVVMPVIDFIANLLGFKDKDMIAVAANTQPLFDEEKAWLLNDNIILKSLLQDTDIVEEMRNTILHGRHNDARGYHRYGEHHYTRGLPSMTFAAGTTTDADRSILGMWKAHCELYGYSNPFSTVASLPIRDYRFDIVTTLPEDLVQQDMVESLDFNNTTESVYVDGVWYEVQWDSLNQNLIKAAGDPNWSDGSGANTPEQEALRVDIYNLDWSITAIGTNEYVESKEPSVSDGILSAPKINRGSYTIDDVILFPNSSAGFTLDLSEVDDSEFPLIVGYDQPVYRNSVIYWVVERHLEELPLPEPDPEDPVEPPELEPKDPVDPEAPLPDPVDPPPEPVFLVSYTVTAGPVETSPYRDPTIRGFSGTINDAIAPSFQFTFYVTNTAYTPYPEDLNYLFKYTVPQERITESDFTGGGADGSIFENYDEDYFDALPVVVLKEEGRWIDADKNSTEYKTSEKLLNHIKLQVQPLVDGIRDSDGGADKELQTAVFRLGVDILTKNQGCLAYVFEFFSMLHNTTIVSKADYDRHDTSAPGTMTQGRVANNVTLQEGSFNSAYHYSYSTRSVVSGLAVKKRGFYETVNTDRDFTITRHNGDGTGVRLFFKDLAGAFAISPSGTSKVKMAGMSITGTSTDPDYMPSFVIPILVGPYKKIKPLQREEVIARSQHLTVTSGTYEKLRWYKSPKFLKTVGIIIIIVTTILSFGTATAPVAATVSAIVAAATTLAVNFAIQLVIGYIKTRILALVFEKIAQALGGSDFAQIVAAIATAATAYYSGMVADFSSLVLETTKAASTFMNGEIGKGLKQLEQDNRSFSERVSALSKEHSEAMESMTIKNVLGLSGLHTYKAESPELFFSRVELDTTELLTTFDAFVGLDLNLDYMTS